MFLSSLFGHMTTLSKQNKTTAPKYKKPKDAILLKMKANLKIRGSDLNNQHKSKKRIVFECPIIKYAKWSVIKSYVIGRVQRFNFCSVAHQFSDWTFARSNKSSHFSSLTPSLSHLFYSFSLQQICNLWSLFFYSKEKITTKKYLVRWLGRKRKMWTNKLEENRRSEKFGIKKRDKVVMWRSIWWKSTAISW